MPVNLEELKRLSVAERLDLIDALWESIEAEPDAFPFTEDQQKELDRRLEAYRADPTAGIPWEEVKRSIIEKERLLREG